MGDRVGSPTDEKKVMMQEHRSTSANAPTRKHTMEKGRGINAPIFLKFETILYGFLCCKDVNARPCLCTGSG
jgi:hypothetical protein